MTLEIIHQDEYLVAINKPNGLLVHRRHRRRRVNTNPSAITPATSEFALQILRDQIGQKVNPIHRLDRKTSGVLLFALDRTVTAAIQEQFIAQQVSKKYIAIVRGFFPEKITVDYPLTNDRNKKQDAVTFFQKIKTAELDIPFGKHQTSRYSLIEAYPQTGRQHQIRKHCNHLRHPIIGDRPHGCNKQNKLFKEKWQMTTMLLHAQELKITHPKTGKELILQAGKNVEFERMEKMIFQ